MEEPVEYNAWKKEETKLIYIKQFRPYKVKLGYTLEKSRNMTRKTAIEKMRKGFVTKYRGYFYCEPKHPNISDCLEAALDALLSK